LSVKQVIVVRKDLGMGIGKTAAQVAHVETLMIIGSNYTNRGPQKENGRTPLTRWLTKAEYEWMTGQYAKIVVGVDTEEELLALKKKAIDLGVETWTVVDNGLTVFKGVKTLTCIGFGPDKSDLVDQVTGGLLLL
jgi:PTH2 family peptidyl-tRNA hydrolase